MSVSRSYSWFSFTNLKGKRNYFYCCRTTVVPLLPLLRVKGYLQQLLLRRQRIQVEILHFPFLFPIQYWDHSCSRNRATREHLRRLSTQEPREGGQRSPGCSTLLLAGWCVPGLPREPPTLPPNPSSAREYCCAAERHSINDHRENSHNGLLVWGKTAAEHLVFLKLQHVISLRRYKAIFQGTTSFSWTRSYSSPLLKQAT